MGSHRLQKIKLSPTFAASVTMIVLVVVNPAQALTDADVGWLCCRQPRSATQPTCSKIILNTVFRFQISGQPRAYIFNFLRRAEGASLAYREARKALIEYVSTPENVISPYFKALLFFEVCISQCYQGYDLCVPKT